MRMEPRAVPGEPAARKMTLQEFRDHGLLLEINRVVLHPRGLAMQVEVEPEALASCLATTFKVEVQDHRDDPLGVCFGRWPADAVAKFRRADQLRDERVVARARAFNWMDGVQPPLRREHCVRGWRAGSASVSEGCTNLVLCARCEECAHHCTCGGL